MNLSKAALAAVTLSVGFVVLYSLLFGVKYEDIASVGFTTFLASCSLVALRLVTQGLRFHILTSVLKLRCRVLDCVFARISSEFVSLTTPTYIGGEAIRIAWLKAKGADLGEAAWLVFLEIYVDVTSTAAVIYASSLYLMAFGEYLLALLAITISTLTTFVFTLIFTYSRKEALQAPSWLSNVIKRILGEARGRRVVESLQQTLLSYHNAASSIHNFFTFRRVAGVAACTIVMILLSGVVTSLIVGGALNLNGLLLSISGFYISLVVGTLPVTIGGSGISELVLNHYSAKMLGFSDWGKVIAWRIVTYHLPLTISGFSLAALSYRELSLRKTADQQKCKRSSSSA